MQTSDSKTCFFSAVLGCYKFVMIFAAGERWEVSPTAWFGSSTVIRAEALK